VVQFGNRKQGGKPFPQPNIDDGKEIKFQDGRLVKRRTKVGDRMMESIPHTSSGKVVDLVIFSVIERSVRGLAGSFPRCQGRNRERMARIFLSGVLDKEEKGW